MKETINTSGEDKKKTPEGGVVGDIDESSPLGQIHFLNHKNAKEGNTESLITEEEINKLLEGNKK